MIMGFCFLLPPILLMYLRDKILGGNGCSFRKDAFSFVREYLITALLLNFAVISIAYIVFGHTGELAGSFDQDTQFTFYYLLLGIFLSLAEPLAENLIRFHVHFSRPFLKNSVNKNIILYLYALVLFLLNFVRIFDNAFWGDEGFTIRLAQMGAPEMIAATAEDVHPPLYYLFAQLLYHIGGNHGVVYHLSALIPYLFLIVIACTAVKKRFGLAPALILVTMSSIMKNAVIYNVEARMYSLAALFVFVAFVSLYGILKDNRVLDWALFCASSLGAAYTHYYALISVAFFYLALFFLFIKKRRLRKRVFLLYFITILAYLPWLTVLAESYGRVADDWWLENIPPLWEGIQFLFDYRWVCVFFAASAFIFALYEFGILNLKIFKGRRLVDRVEITFSLPGEIKFSSDLIWAAAGLLSIFGTLLIGFALSYLIRPIFIVRYLFPVTPVLYLIMGFCLSKLHFKRLWTIILAVGILCVNLPAYAYAYQTDRELDRENSRFLNAVNPPSDAVLYTNDAHLALALLEYYYPENCREYSADPMEALDRNRGEIWLIWLGEIEETVQTAMEEQGSDLEWQYEGRFASGATYHVYKLNRKG